MNINKLVNYNTNALPDICPKCNCRLKHVNAIDTEAKTYFIYCPNSGCRYAVEYRICKSCGGWVKI